jgi:hypothetical protein
MVAEFAKRAVVEAFPDTYILLEVAFVVVELSPVKFWNVDEAYARILFAVKPPTVARFANKLVVLAVVAKRAVVVAFVVVAFTPVKF